LHPVSDDQAWDALEEAIWDHDMERIIDVLNRSSAPERKSWFRRLRSLRRREGARMWSSYPGQLNPAAVCEAAEFVCAPNAVTAARIVTNQGLFYTHSFTARLLEAIDQDLLPELLERLAARNDRTEIWTVTEALRVHLGAAYPEQDGYLCVLVWQLARTNATPLRARLLADDSLRALVPRILEIPDIGWFLGMGSTTSHQEWFRETDTVELMLDEFSRDGLLDRAVLLDRTRAALRRGGKATHVAFFIRLHDQFEPDASEIAVDLDAYLELLADGAGSVAGLAQRALVKAWQAELLDSRRVTQISSLVVTRPQKMLVIAQLRWLADIGARDPGSAAEVARAIEPGLRHQRADVRDAVAAVASTLTGASSAATIPPTPRAAGTAPRTRPAEPPLRSLGELVEAVNYSLEHRAVLLTERIADGVSRFGADRDGFAAAFEPLVSRMDYYGAHLETAWINRPELALVLGCLAGEDSRGASMTEWGPALALSIRLREVLRFVLSGRSQPLLALPTSRTGGVDPGTLVERMHALEAASGEPGELDVEQAWIRLPRPFSPDLVDASRGFTTPAGRRLSGLLIQGPLADPHTWRSAGDRRRKGPTVVIRPSDLTRERELAATIMTIPSSYRSWWDDGYGPPLAASWLAPQHREIGAVEALTAMWDPADRPSEDLCEIVSSLPEAAGPLGAGTHLLLAYAAGHSSRKMRACAVDALLGLAESGSVDADEFADACGSIFGPVSPGSRLVEVFTELVRFPGQAKALVAQTVIAWLPSLLTGGLREAPRLLMTAADAAAGLGLTVHSEPLEAVAASKGSTRLQVEARRLRDAVR
jgi:hypothetical protein